jgi:hypothetical protein
MTDHAHVDPLSFRMTRTMTVDRVRRYSEGLHTTGSGADAMLGVRTAPDAGTDPPRIAEGMVVTNWIASLLAEQYGQRFLEGGALRTRFVRPVHEGLEVTVLIDVDGPLRGDKLRFSLECVSELGVHLVGDAEVVAGPDSSAGNGPGRPR